jgi:hypothetical protein
MTALDLRLGMSMGFTALLVLLPRRIWMTSGRHLDIIPSLVAFLGRFFNSSLTLRGRLRETQRLSDVFHNSPPASLFGPVNPRGIDQ